MKKQARLTAFLAAAAVAPAVLFASPAVAAQAPATANSAPDHDTEATKKQEGRSAEDDRVAILRMLADKNAGAIFVRDANKALDGTDEELREFLKTGQYIARDMDNSIAITRIHGAKDAGPRVKEEAHKALKGSPQDRVDFLKRLPLIRFGDNVLRTVQISSIGGPAVREAAHEALRTYTPEAIQHFLDVGQYEARAKDEAAAKKAEEEKAAKEKAAKDKAAKEKAAKEKAAKEKGAGGKAAEDGGKNVTPAVDTKPAGGHGTTGSGTPSGTAVTSTGSDTTSNTSTGSSLAATGVSPVTPWAASGAAVAVAAGAGLVVAGRRRTTAERG
ncbi:ALF repeat-containing protein [Streptomyces chrestomyceticus]|uniref:ALF repeat-containing protein n=1 Tax=Streptomyces chrestomyceticus TaxID=68185 RepID=UPI0036753CB9